MKQTGCRANTTIPEWKPPAQGDLAEFSVLAGILHVDLNVLGEHVVLGRERLLRHPGETGLDEFGFHSLQGLEKNNAYCSISLFFMMGIMTEIDAYAFLNCEKYTYIYSFLQSAWVKRISFFNTYQQDVFLVRVRARIS